jgi:hypothetical protein
VSVVCVWQRVRRKHARCDLRPLEKPPSLGALRRAMTQCWWTLSMEAARY